MHAQSPSAYTLSVLLHGVFAAAILFIAFAFRDETSRKSTEVFELVAGAGDNWSATEAPALGSPGGVEFKPAPTPPERLVQSPVVPPKPEPTPIAPSPIQAVVPSKPEVVAKKPEAKPKPEKTFAQQIQQTAARKESQIVSKFRKEEAARRKAEEKAAALAAKRMTKEEFDKLNGKKTAANSTSKSSSVSYEKITTKGIDGGGATDQSGAGGKALSRAEQEQLGTYFAALKEKIKAAHQKPDNVSDQLSARISFYVAANGAIGQVKIIRSSGNAEFDRSVIEAVRAVHAIGPRPDERGDTREADFNMRDAH
jgi:colicin import membrane protein